VVSDGEFIVNAGAAGKNRALLEMINSGKAPRFAAGSVSSIQHLAHVYSPTLNIDVHGPGDRSLANQIAGAVGKTLDSARPDTFGKSSGQILGGLDPSAAHEPQARLAAPLKDHPG